MYVPRCQCEAKGRVRIRDGAVLLHHGIICMREGADLRMALRPPRCSLQGVKDAKASNQQYINPLGGQKL